MGADVPDNQQDTKSLHANFLLERADHEKSATLSSSDKSTSAATSSHDGPRISSEPTQEMRRGGSKMMVNASQINRIRQRRIFKVLKELQAEAQPTLTPASSRSSHAASRPRSERGRFTSRKKEHDLQEEATENEPDTTKHPAAALVQNKPALVPLADTQGGRASHEQPASPRSPLPPHQTSQNAGCASFQPACRQLPLAHSQPLLRGMHGLQVTPSACLPQGLPTAHALARSCSPMMHAVDTHSNQNLRQSGLQAQCQRPLWSTPPYIAASLPRSNSTDYCATSASFLSPDAVQR